jgi:hypothetical protein
MRRAAQWHGAFPAPQVVRTADGFAAIRFAPADVLIVRRYIEQHRSTNGPFDLVISHPRRRQRQASDVLKDRHDPAHRRGDHIRHHEIDQHREQPATAPTRIVVSLTAADGFVDRRRLGVGDGCFPRGGRC